MSRSQGELMKERSVDKLQQGPPRPECKPIGGQGRKWGKESTPPCQSSIANDHSRLRTSNFEISPQWTSILRIYDVRHREPLLLFFAKS